MIKPCKVCGVGVELAPYQIRCRRYICLRCQRQIDKEKKRTRGDRHSAAYREKIKSSSEYKARKAENMRRYLSDPENLRKQRDREKVNHNIVSGKITRKPCEVCGEAKTEAHHVDYDQPLNVIWLCIKHHKQEHSSE